MSENTPSIHQEISNPIEKSIQTGAWQQAVLDKDPRLQKLSQDPEKNRVILDVLSQNQAIFERSDNPAEQSRLLGESLKEYGQMASNGESFENLAALSPEEMAKLPPKIQTELENWMDNQNSLRRATVVGIDTENAGKKATVVSKQIEGKELDATVVGIDTENAGKKATVIEFQEKNTKAEEILKNIKLSSNDDTKVKSLLADAKSGIGDNAAVEELKKQGVTRQDIASGKYDSYISASIIVEHAGEFAKNAPDPEAFKKSIHSLQSLGIPVRVQPDFASVSSHINERFASGDRKDTVIADVRRDLTSGQYQGVHYDGVGERYTLIGSDGQTRKDLYMEKPPRESIRRNGLTIDREIPQESADEKKRSTLKEKYTSNLSEAQRARQQLSPVIANNDENQNTKMKELYQGTVDATLPVAKRLENIQSLKEINASRTNQSMQAVLDGGSGDTHDQLEHERHGLDTLQKVYEAEQSLLESAKILPIPSMDTFDTTANNNLTYLVDKRFDRMGPGADQALDRIITGLNRGKDASNQIDLSKNTLDQKQQAALEGALIKLGGTPDVLTDASRLAAFQQSINQKLTLPQDHQESIENIVSKV